MAQAVDFKGSTDVLGGGADNVSDLHVHRNGVSCTSCWQLSPEELQEVIASGGKVFLSVFFGQSQPPVFLGSESEVRDMISDYGVWSK